MIVPDASVLIPWLSGGENAHALTPYIEVDQVILAPVVVAEALSGPNTPDDLAAAVAEFPILATRRGYWVRAGLLRRQMLRAGRRARLADTLLAQSCLDHDLPLLTRDGDFQAFAEVANLRLA